MRKLVDLSASSSLPQIEEKLGYPINKNLVLVDNKYIIENFLLKN